MAPATAAIFRDIRESGFTITDLLEPTPLVEAAHSNPAFHQIHHRLPLFMIVELQKGH